MIALAAMLVAASAALSQAEQAVLIDGPLEAVAVPTPAELPPARLAKAQAIWVWSALREPRRLSPDDYGRHRQQRPLVAARTLLVRVPAARGGRSLGLRVIAAPLAMWSEVPEPLLPSWPLPRSGRLRIPVDGERPWRLRVAGERAGSFWIDLPIGAPGAVVPVVEAAGSHFVVVGEGEGAVKGSSVRVLEDGPGRPGGARSWAFLVGDEKGRFELPGLPDRSELRWLAAASGHPPKLVLSAPSRLAKIVLAPGTTVSGRVVDPSGRPIAGVAARVAAWVTLEAPIPLIVDARTDTQGRFAAAAVPPGKAIFEARHDGWAALRLPIEVAADGLDLGPLALSRGDSLAVRVVDDTGEPIVGAELRPEPGDVATTDRTGLATLEHLPSGGDVRITATAEGHLRGERSVVLPGPPLEVVLERAFGVSGRFLGTDGSPLEGAAVKVAHGNSSGWEVVDPDGGFALSLRPGQEHTLTFTSPRSRALELAVARGDPGETRDLGELRAPRSGTVTGRLVDGATGDPVAGGRVWCPRTSAHGPVLAWMGGDLLETSSGPDGAFRLNGVPGGAARLRIEAPGFAQLARSVDVPGEGSKDLGDMTLSRGATLVVSAGPKGEGATIAVDVGGESLPFDRLTATVEDGVGRVAQVRSGAARVAVQRGSAVLCEKTVDVPADTEEMPVECSAEGISVHGVVTLGDRRGAGTLVWEPPAGSLPEGIMTFRTGSGLTQQQVYTTSGGAVSVAVAAGGTFATRELRAGTWQVTYEPEEGAATRALAVTLSEQSDQALVLPYPGHSVSGTVRDDDGQTVEGARVRDLGSGTTTFTRRDGSFRVDGLEAGTYYFKAAKDRLTSEAVEVAVGDDPPRAALVLVLRPDGSDPTIDFLVSDGSGAAAAGAFVFVEIAGRGLQVLTADATGVARLRLDPPYPPGLRAAAYLGGSWSLGGWQPLERAREGISVSLGPTGAMAVHARSNAGLLEIDAPGGWNMALLLTMLGMRPQLEPGAVLELGGLPVGTYQLLAGQSTASAAVRENQHTEVDLPSD